MVVCEAIMISDIIRKEYIRFCNVHSVVWVQTQHTTIFTVISILSLKPQNASTGSDHREADFYFKE